MRTICAAVRRDAEHLREALLQMGRQRSLRDPFFSTCETLKLSPAQFHTLMWLGTDLKLSMGVLSRRIGVSDKTMTGLVDRLERGGYARRTRDPEDRRVIQVQLTPKGAATFEKLDRQVQEKLAGLLGLLCDADRKTLLQLFDKLLARFAGSKEEAA